MHAALLMLALYQAPQSVALDQAALTIRACGQPRSDQQVTVRDDVRYRKLVYSDITLVFHQFGKDPKGWSFNMGMDDQRHIYDASGAAAIKPCMAGVVNVIRK